MFVVPDSLRKGLTIRFHDLQSHMGVDRTVAKLREFYYFPGMIRYVRQHVKNCIQCILSKTKTGPQSGELHPIQPGNRPFAKIHIDHSGPYVTTARRNTYILALTDTLTRFVILFAVRDTKAVNVVRSLEDFILDFGAPINIISDRGTCFTSHLFEEFCSKHGIRHTLNSPRHPQANGLVERMNGTLIPAIQANIESNSGKDWDKQLKKVQRDLNSSINKTTGKSPFELLYGYVNRHDEGALRILTVHDDKENYVEPAKLQEKALQCIEIEQCKYKNRYDKNRNILSKFNIGEIVYMRNYLAATGESTKLQPKFQSPLIVTKVYPSDTYGIVDLQVDSLGRRYAATAHAQQLKGWKPSYDENDNYLESDDEN